MENFELTRRVPDKKTESLSCKTKFWVIDWQQEITHKIQHFINSIKYLRLNIYILLEIKIYKNIKFLPHRKHTYI
jgi:hypothetical protein